MADVVTDAGRPQVGIGSEVKRVEDPALLRGEGTYVDDLEFPGMLHAAVLRSPIPHARIKTIDASAALAESGVHCVLVESDLQEMGIGELPAIWVRPGQKSLHHPLLARDTVRYVGEAIAMVAADSRELAEDAVELISVEFEELPPLVDPVAALEDEDAPLLYPEWGDNICVHLVTEGGNAESAFEEADVVLAERMTCQRYSGIPLETRGAIARLERVSRGGSGMTIWSSTQVIHHARDIIAQVLGWPEHRLRVIALDVGGGFGPKDHAYPEEILVGALAIKTEQPVKWIEDRREHLTSTVHAREQVHDVELAARKDGVILGLRDRMVSNMGALASNVGAGPVSLSRVMLPGPYDVKNYRAEAFGMVTNKVPSGAYRGFGMTQSTFVMERMIDLLAHELEMDPAEVRRKNFIPATSFPYHETITGLTYDSGNYEDALARALKRVDYEGWRQKQEEWREQGRYIGIGLSSYVEMAAFAPSRELRDLGFALSGVDAALLKVDMQGKVSLFTGINSTGQGHQTSFAQVAAEALGVDFDDITVVQGDTASSPYAPAGAIASRGGAVCGAAILMAGEKLRDKLQQVAGHMFEAAPEDIEIKNSQVYVKGSPDRSRDFSEVAREALLGHNLPDGMVPGLEEQAVYDPSGLTYPYATHIAVVEIDPETGQLQFLRYVVVHDCGTIINPTVVEGQIHGGIAQGIGGAILEEFAYSDDGQPLATSFMDYLLPTATDMPDIEVEHTVTPSPVTPGGMKGMGEGGAIAAPAAVGNAVDDALSPFGVRVRSTPLSPSHIWQLIQDAKGGSSNGGPTS